jgi:hypothetical protein
VGGTVGGNAIREDVSYMCNSSTSRPNKTVPLIARIFQSRHSGVILGLRSFVPIESDRMGEPLEIEVSVELNLTTIQHSYHIQCVRRLQSEA